MRVKTCCGLALLMSIACQAEAQAHPSIRSMISTASDAVSAFLRPNARIAKASDPASRGGWTLPGTPPGYLVISSAYSSLYFKLTWADGKRGLFHMGVKDPRVSVDPDSCAPADGIDRLIGTLTCTLKLQ